MEIDGLKVQIYPGRNKMSRWLENNHSIEQGDLRWMLASRFAKGLGSRFKLIGVSLMRMHISTPHMKCGGIIFLLIIKKMPRSLNMEMTETTSSSKGTAVLS